ncbi:MAG: hypothetical protein NTX68_00035 [Rhodococcus sp.]|jgi:hypothetical protein|uniref:hypothetical protein n=1 Tax=Rhodococcoides fascians TaxID=1828 RepID=UPI001DC76E2B|nr:MULTISPECIES: hypothetical protein [Rhodococcus]MCX6489361.1 hypothetical protein [Rhodococcus sp. (in: high G+C Gram-positive bacteria)]CAH0315515.1 hypothetical protein SRABI91_05133 [Rhodococcus fascians]
MSTAPTRTSHHLTSHDRHRALTALALTSVIVWTVWAVPVARLILESMITTIKDSGRAAATRDVLAHGWWAVIVVTAAMTIGSLIAVADASARAQNWTVTALRKAIHLAATALVMWAIWTVSVVAAAGVPTVG